MDVGSYILLLLSLWRSRGARVVLGFSVSVLSFLGVPSECFVGRQRLSSSKVMGSLAGEADAGSKRDCLPSGDRGSR